MKKYYTLACLCLLFNFQFSIFNSPTASAQHFEWAKGYGSAVDDGNSIVGTVADSEGNLYILGDFHPDAEWDGVPLMPFTPYGNAHNTRSVVVAKISPSGEMLWRKVIHANNNSMSRGFDIRMMGDTAIAFMARCNPPTRVNYLYYLDTLYANEEKFFFDMTYLRWYAFTVFVVLDLDGNMLENHVLHTTYVDRDGNDIMYEQTTAIGTWDVYDNNEIYEPSFDIDPEGNIYLCRLANDFISGYAGLPGYDLENGDLSAVKLWVDDRVAGVMDIPKGTRYWFPQLIKLSPHMDTVLASRYLVQKGRSGIPYTENLVKCRQNGDVYVIWNIPDTRNFTDTIVCDSMRNIQFKLLEQYGMTGFLHKLDSNLEFKWAITLDKDSIISPNRNTALMWGDLCFDEDSNLLFLSSKYNMNTPSGDTSNYCAILTYNGEEIPVQRSTSIILALKEIEHGKPILHACGFVPSKLSSTSLSSRFGNMTCFNNRVFLQTKYKGGIRYPDRTIEFDNWSKVGHCFVSFDYQMNLIGGIDYNTHSPNSLLGPIISPDDSVLYLINYISDGQAQFGGIQFQGDPSKHYACIEKYVDTAFMTPYVHTGDTGNVRIVLAENDSWIAAYPNPFRQRVVIQIENSKLKIENGIVTAILTDLTGRREEVRLTPIGSGQYSLDLTSRPQATYLLTLTTTDGKQHTVRLLKQSDIFGERN